MNPSNESVVFSGLSGLIRNNVCTPLVQFLASNGVQHPLITVEKFCEVLKLSATNVAPVNNSLMMPNFPMPGMSSLPGMPATAAPPTLTGLGGMPMPMQASTKKGSKKSGPSEAVPPNERCQYIVTRGRNKDQQCVQRAEAGRPFCTGCKDKKAAQQQLQSGRIPATATAPSMGIMPNISGLPTGQMLPGMPGLSQLNPSLTPSLMTPQPAGTRLKVAQLHGGFYHETDHNLLIKIGSQANEYICCGVYDPKTGSSGPLTPDKIQKCKELNITYVDPSKQDTTTLPSVPSIGQQMPNINTFNLPSTQQYTLPGVPAGGLALPGISAMGAPSALPQVPPAGMGMGMGMGMSMGMGMGMLSGMPALSDLKSADDPDDDIDDDDDDDGDS